jgi:outer membrane protein OmpA-like peptidoglycan-associated protein
MSRRSALPHAALRRHGLSAVLAVSLLAAAGCASTRSQAQAPASGAAAASAGVVPLRAAPAVTTRERLRRELAAVPGIEAWPVETEAGVLRLVLPARASFSTDSARLLAPAAVTLAGVARVFERSPRLRFVVAGHTDSVGRAAYNEEFSRQRALAVAAVLTGSGIAPERIEIRAAGEREPRTAEADLAGREANRRVEILVYESLRQP